MSEESDLDELDQGPYRTPGKRVRFGDPTFAMRLPSIEQATGRYLDLLGENVAVEREVIVPTRLTAPEIAEPDQEYRERIRQAIALPPRRA